MLTEPTRIFGIIGTPVAQVRSPEVFNDRFQRAGLDAVMVPLWVERDLVDLLRALRAVRNLVGLVITVPHKPTAAAAAVGVSRRAKLARAANALRPVEGGWEADLFDGEGFVAGLRAHDAPLKGARCAIIGAGGAGSAIAVALLEHGAAALKLHDIDIARAKNLRDRLLAAFSVPVSVGTPDGSCELVVNATPVGMEADDPLPLDLAVLAREAWIADVIMKPETTRLLVMARALGHPVVAGRHMLDGQVSLLWDFFHLRRERASK